MNNNLSTDLQDVRDSVHYRPAVTIILPFEPRISLKSEMSNLLKVTADKVERELQADYPADLCGAVMQKLRKIIRELKVDTDKKSIAIFVSPVFEKILYLDIPVEERIKIGESFEIRDLVYARKELHKYLVLLLSYHESRMYLGNSNSLVKIKLEAGESIHPFINDAPERVANFSDMSERKETLMEKFLLHVDHNLDTVLNAYQLPVFVLGTKRIAGHFKKLTRHEKAVVQYIHGNYEEATAEELKKVLEPHVSDWLKVKNIDLINRVQEAYGKGKLAAGMKEVWQQAVNQKGRLLVVEKNFTYPALQGSKEDRIYTPVEPYNKFSYIQDAVDQVIEKVLESGGDVEFVEKDLLTEYDHIALIQYY